MFFNPRSRSGHETGDHSHGKRFACVDDPPHPLRRYRILSFGVILGLVLTSGILAFLNLSQGPRLKLTRFNTVAVTEQPGQTLTMQTNQPLVAIGAEDVSVSPRAPFKVEQVENGLIVRFTEPLHYASSYTVTARVRGAQTGAASQLSTTFTTQDPLITTLIRTGKKDRLEQQRLVSGTGHRVLLEGERIQEYALLNDQVILVSASSLGEHPGVGSVSLSNHSYTPLVEGQISRVQQLHVETRTRVAGYLLDGTDVGGGNYTGFLLLHDLRFGVGPPVQVLGPSLKPLVVRRWRFEAGTTRAIIEASDGAFYSFDVLGENVAATPLTASRVRAEGLLGEQPANPQELREGSMTLQLVDVSGKPAREGAKGSRILVTEGRKQRELFSPASATSRLGRLCLSPNKEYVAVEVISEEAEPDGYASEPGFTHTSTAFVRISDAATVRGVSGMRSSWCHTGTGNNLVSD